MTISLNLPTIPASFITNAMLANSVVTPPKLDGAQSGTAPAFVLRSWVVFNGTSTVTILASGNVSSIGDRGAGLYTVNFITAMPDVNYAVSGILCGGGGNNVLCQQSTDGATPPSGTEKSVSACQINTVTGSPGTLFDSASVSVFFTR